MVHRFVVVFATTVYFLVFYIKAPTITLQFKYDCNADVFKDLEAICGWVSFLKAIGIEGRNENRPLFSEGEYITIILVRFV